MKKLMIFFQTIDKIITIEHQADDVNRKVNVAIMNESNNFKQLHVLSEISRNVEDVTGLGCANCCRSSK